MIKLDSTLEDMLASGVTTFATCWRLTKISGEKQCFTSFDTDLVIEGDTFVSSGVSQTTVKSFISMESNTIDLYGLVESVSVDNVYNEEYDQAIVEVFNVDYTNIPAKLTDTNVLWLKRGIVGELFYDDNTWVIEVRGFKDQLKQRTGAKTSRLCKAEFGDNKCRADLSLYSHVGNVVSYKDKVLVTDITTLPDGKAKQGVVKFNTLGYSYDVVASSGGTLTLMNPISFDPVGLEVKVIQGCNKWLDDCQSYNNILNYQGEPHVPSEDEWAAGYFDTIRG